jgi:hypothetical protein
MAQKVYSTAANFKVRKRLYVKDRMIRAYIQLGEPTLNAVGRVNTILKEIKCESIIKFQTI